MNKQHTMGKRIYRFHSDFLRLPAYRYSQQCVYARSYCMLNTVAQAEARRGASETTGYDEYVECEKRNCRSVEYKQATTCRMEIKHSPQATAGTVSAATVTLPPPDRASQRHATRAHSRARAEDGHSTHSTHIPIDIENQQNTGTKSSLQNTCQPNWGKKEKSNANRAAFLKNLLRALTEVSRQLVAQLELAERNFGARHHAQLRLGLRGGTRRLRSKTHRTVAKRRGKKEKMLYNMSRRCERKT